MKPTPCVRRGIIPACAGNTCSKRNHLNIVGDHPRVCGEHTRFVVKSKVAVGSSPRVRGTLWLRRRENRRAGIIPACAGNTPREGCIPSGRRDHPRVCGEHLRAKLHDLRDLGSSPRVRGTHAGYSLGFTDTGIIPACAGNTIRISGRVFLGRDHPRVCGEHAITQPPSRRLWGSSPRVRGTLVPADSRFRRTGIIPACAGNTPPCRTSFRLGRDHPRVCGEHVGMNSTAKASVGSSPRVRGTLFRHTSLGRDVGIIPACAGNTDELSKAVKAKDGSSPRVRGTLHEESFPLAPAGIIPACAGNTLG